MSLHALELRTTRLTLTVPSAVDAGMIAHLVVEQGVLVDEQADPYGDDWVRVAGDERRRAFQRMVDEARASLGRPGSFTLPLMARHRDTGAVIGLFEIKGDHFPATGRFEGISIVLRPHQTRGFALPVAVASMQLMFDVFNAKNARADIYMHNRRAIHAVERLGAQRTGQHLSVRPGHPQPTWEYEIAREDWPAISARRPIAVDIVGIDEFLQSVHPDNDLLAFRER